jgi:hypothetical protein
MQSLGMNYTQQVSRLFELSSSNIYYVGGRTMGNANTNRVAGPRRMTLEFYKTYGDVCNAKTNTLHMSAQAGCNAASLSRQSYSAHFVVLTSMTVQVAAADAIINEALQFIYSSLLLG